MDPSKDYFLAERPPDPEFRETASFWVFDQRGEIGIPRMGIEAVAGSWDLRGLQVNIGFPDGRAVVVRTGGQGRSPVDADGVCRTFAAGGLTFGCPEPFQRLTASYEGEAVDTTAAAMARGESSGAGTRPLGLEVEVLHRSDRPGSRGRSCPNRRSCSSRFRWGFFMTPRYEQLFAAQGWWRSR